MLLDRMVMSVGFLFIVWLQLAVNIKLYNKLIGGGGGEKRFSFKILFEMCIRNSSTEVCIL